MSLEPNYEKVVSSYKRRIGEMQSQIECRLPVMESSEISKVLSANVNVNMLNANASQNVVNFDGVAVAQVIYATMDNEYKAIDYTLEFKDRYVAQEELNVSDIVIKADVIDVRAVVENGAIKVSAILNIVIDGIFADNINMLMSATGEGVYTKCEDVEFAQFIGCASERFDTTADIEIVDAIDSILAVSPKAYIDRVESYDNYVKVVGNVAVTITYLSSGERACVRTYDASYDFAQELALSGTSNSSIVNSILSCMYSNINVTTNLGQDKSVINLIVPIDYKGYVWNQTNIQVVSDIYSANNELKVDSNNFVIQHNNSPQVFVERINGSVSIEENDLSIDEVLGTCCNNVVIANNRVDGDILIVDGVASTTVLYKNNETNKIVSFDVQIPFSVDLNVGKVESSYDVQVLAELVKLQVKARRGTEIELNGDLVLYVDISYKNTDVAISHVEELGEKQKNNDNLVIYVAKSGDTIWEIAKEMSVSEETILDQNPNLSLPIEAGSRIIVYRQTTAQIV